MDSGTIVAAALDSTQLEQSINKLVQTVASKTKEMADNFTSEVGRMEQAVKNLGNIKIDTGSSNDGGTGRRTQQHEKLTKAVNDASEAVSKETQKLQDLQQSLSGASDREQNFISQKERAANTIAQENELLGKQQSELSGLRTQQAGVTQEVEKYAQASRNASSLRTKYEKSVSLADQLEKEYEKLKSMPDQSELLKKYNKDVEKFAADLKANLEKVRSARRESIGFGTTDNWLSIGSIDAIARHGIDKYTKDYINRLKEIARKELYSQAGDFDFKAGRTDGLKEIRQYIQDIKSTRERLQGILKSKDFEFYKPEGLKAAIQYYKDIEKEYTAIEKRLSGLHGKYQTAMSAPDNSVKIADAQIKLSQAYNDVVVNTKAVTKAEGEVFAAREKSAQASQQKAQIDAQVAAKEKEIAETKGRIATATREQTEAERNASQAAREKANIQGQVANQEKQVAEAKKQLTTATQQQAEVEKQSVQNVVQQTAARDKQIKKNQEVAASFDKMASAQQVSIRSASPSGIRNADTLQTMNIQLDLLRERLREARNQYSSFIALASHATTTGDKGLYQFATEGVHKYGDEVRTLIPQIRGLQNAIQQMGDVIAPQGHTIQNYVNSLQKTNPELAQLNEQFKKGQSELQNQSTSYSNATQSAHQYTEEIRRQAQAIRESQQYQKGERVVIATKQDGTEIVAFSEKRLSLEEQIINAKKAVVEETAKQKKEEEETVQATRLAGEELKKIYQDQKAVNEEINKRVNGIRNGGTTPFQSYDNLRQSIASVLGIQEQQVKMANAEKDSYNQLSSTLKQLSQAYYALGKSDRKSDQGTALVASMHEVERAMQKIKAQAARPVSLESIIGINGKGGLSEKTLDDIAYKMQRLSSLRSGLNVETQQTEIRTVNTEYDRLKKKMDEVMQKNQSMIASNNALGRSWNYMKNRLAFYFTVGASTQFIKNLIEVRSQYEMNERALGILIGSAERGTQVFSELSQMALVSPYTLIELSNAAKQLTAYDIAAKDVVETTRRLADMASAVGVPMERLTYALGQIKAYGYLNSRDARMFANAGIPLVRELSKYYSELEGKVVSVGDVYTRMKKKAIEYNDVMAVVTKMTDEGGKFFDFQAKMANTLKVQLANLTLAWNNMLNDLGASQQGVLVGGIAALKNLFLHWQDIYDIITKVAYAFGLYKLAQATTLIWTGRITTAMGMQELVGKKLQARLAGLTATNKSFVAASTTGWMALAAVVVEVLYTWHRNVEEIERLNKTIADGAKESAKALDEFINSAEMSYARLSAQTGKLPKSEAEKTWESLREQIEISSASSDQIIPKLLEIGDLNQRLTTAFGLAEKIKEANEKLGDLEDTLDVSQDSILGGLLGEGLIEDIEDYNEHLAYSSEKAEYFAKKNHGFWENAAMGLKALYNEVRDSMGSSTDEAEKEITNFAKNAAQTIKDELGEEGLKDKIQVNEAIARVVSGVEQMFPKLRGKGKMLFETMFNDVMAQEFNGAVDKQAYYYKLFLERLKKDHGSAFQGVTDDILKETHRWSSGQQDAIKKTAEKVKTDLPLASQDAIDQILNQLNKTDFKLRIVTEFATTTLDEVQKQFKDRFISKPWIADQKEREKAETEAQQRYGNLMRKTTEDNVTYEKRISDERKKQLEISQKNADIIAENKNKQDALSKSILKDAQEQKKTADDWLKAAEEVEHSGGYDFSTKKESAAATKAQKQAESELQKALKEELSIIDKIRSSYQALTKEGMSHADAIKASTAGYEKSAKSINQTLTKFGLQAFDPSAFAGISDPNDLVRLLEDQLNKLIRSGKAKPAEIKDLEVKINDVKLDAEKYNLTKITKGLNNELDRLKDEYELAVSLDADPELGNMFADWMGIDVNDLPRTASEYAERASKILNNKLKDLGAKTKLPSVLDITDDDMRAFEENKVFTDKQLELVKKAVDAARGFQKKETEEKIKDWDKLLEKYAEYETKVNKIQNDAVKERVTFAQQFGNDNEKSLALNLQTQILAATDQQEKQKLIQQLQELVKSIAGNDKTKLNIVTSINTGETKNLAKASFEEFQKSPEWITATGELSGMTNKAINGLIASLEKYKKSAKNLDPKQIKNINNALKNLYKEQRKNNPFGAIANMLDKAKERMADVEPEMESIMSDIIALEKEIGDGEATEGQIKTLDELKKRWLTLSKIGEISAGEWVDSIMSVYGAIKGAIGLFDDLAKAIGGTSASDIEKVFGVLEKAGQGAQIGAAFGGYGAAIGAVVGGLTGVIETFADVWSGNADITSEVEKSTRAVKRLELAYVDLQQAVDKAYGTAVIGAKQATLANKELQLAELQRQIQLEKSRKSKNRDEDKILDLQKQYKELFYEIQNGYTEIVDDLMGTDVASFAENLVSSMIDAFKQGEDYMDVFNKKFDEMIDNMIMKSIVSRVVSQYLNQIWDSIDRRINERSKEEADEYGKLQNEVSNRRMMSDEEIRDVLAKKNLGSSFAPWEYAEEYKAVTQKQIDDYRKAVDAEAEAAKARLDAATEFTGSDVDYIMGQIAEVMPELGQKLKDILGEYYKFGESSEAQLSGLQQGIQGITEDTAGALEAYMNGVSQQVYLQSDLLTQIRDAVVGFNLDVQVATMSQILLQLQSSYTVQMSIQGILEGTLNPSGQGFRVELIS